MSTRYPKCNNVCFCFPFFFFPLLESSGSPSRSGESTPSLCCAVQALCRPLPPLTPFRITGPKVCIGGFGGKEGNSVVEGARLVLTTADGGNAYVDAGVVMIVRVDWTGRLATAGDTQGEVPDTAVRLVEAGGGTTKGDAAVPQAPCRALCAEGVVEDFIFNTRAPPAPDGVTPLPANGG